ncbi:DUF445 domain-containing protein [Xylanivirga thermophila]|uniref:DUF445 domain-containing protein n=1 Tax=Xylanivirga thermophila TaxID=2496273 RepID=UPI00101E01B4|nr:DUF445 family protein [Xylanivirga thermophila]
MAAVIRIVIMSVVAALIGWVTNLLAIKMIFRPLNPVKIPVLGIEFQGLIPKRKKDIAVSIGRTVEEQLISIDDVLDTFTTRENKDRILHELKEKVIKVVDEKMPRFVPGFIKGNIINYIEDMIDGQGEQFMESFIEDSINKAAKSISVAQMVEDKINSFDLLTLENMVIGIANKELKHIEVLGGVLGFFIGLVQGLILQVIPFK